MNRNEKITDIFIAKLLSNSKINFVPNGSNIKEIKAALKTASKKGTGKVGFPEFTAKSNDFVLVIENKANFDNQAKYGDDEQNVLAMDKKAIANFAENGALHYAQKIVATTTFKKVFAFGCSGNERHYTIRPIYVDENGYKILQTVENFENFSSENIENYYREQVLEQTPKEVLEQEAVIKKAATLHEMLRNYGQLRDTEKPLVVSAILLALSEPTFNIKQLHGDTIKTDGQIIYASIETQMSRVKVEPEVKKQELLNQFIIIKDRTILNKKDERLTVEIEKDVYLEKTPLKYFTEYIHEHIIEAIKANSKEDILGKFYGEFISYGGGDGQTLGIVLTPDHVAELFCDLVSLKPSDIVFDPCCGTGSFLIAAMHKMIAKSDKAAEESIKKERLHGIEIREDMFAIATTNMILRGDGKSNLIKADFLRTPISELREKNYTVGFMNPPYSQAKSKDTAHLSEISFIEHLLDSLADGGRCVVIVPQSTMVGKRKTDKQTKKRILEKHTLEGVITLNKETFYGVGTNPCLAIFKAHIPHDFEKRCKFINFEDDGFIVRKHVGLVDTTRAISQKKKMLDCWFDKADAKNHFLIKTNITADDEWLHSFYYFNDEIPTDKDFEKTIADYLTFEFSMIMQGRQYLFENKE